MGQLPDMGGAILALGALCGLVGWGAIEVVLWIFSNINIGWG